MAAASLNPAGDSTGRFCRVLLDSPFDVAPVRQEVVEDFESGG